MRSPAAPAIRTLWAPYIRHCRPSGTRALRKTWTEAQAGDIFLRPTQHRQAAKGEVARYGQIWLRTLNNASDLRA